MSGDTEGYAATAGGEPVVNTVSRTVRGAKVNGLVVIFGIVPLDSWTDAVIQKQWEECVKAQPHIGFARVRITVV